MPPSRTAGIVAGLAAALSFGLVNAVGRIALRDVDPLALAAVGYALAGIALLPFLLASRFGRRDVVWLVAMAILGGALAPFLFLAGLARTTAVDASLIIASEIVFTSGLAYLFLRERLAFREVVGAALLVGGALLVATRGAVVGGGSLAGNLLVLGAAVTFSVDNVIATRLSARHSAVVLVAVKVAGGAVLLGIAAFALGHALPPRELWPHVGFIGLVGIGVANVLFFLALRNVGASRTTMLFSTSSFFGAAAGVLLLAEPFGVVHAVAAVLLASGIALLFAFRETGTLAEQPG